MSPGQSKSLSLRTRFFERVSIGGFNACWKWRGVPSSSGYATVKIDRRTFRAHRVVYEWLRGSIPAGCHVHHVCKNKLCVNPDHLRVETPGSHLEAHDHRGARATQEKWRSITHCRHGHEYNEANTLVTRQGHRKCRVCKRKLDQARRAKPAMSRARLSLLSELA